MTWYPGKQNSLVFHSRDGESLKELLIGILTNKVISENKYSEMCDDDSQSAIVQSAGGSVGTKLPSAVLKGGFNTTVGATNDLVNIKSDVLSRQKQMECINGVIDATNAIIESMSVILSPPENRGTA